MIIRYLGEARRLFRDGVLIPLLSLHRTRRWRKPEERVVVKDVGPDRAHRRPGGADGRQHRNEGVHAGVRAGQGWCVAVSCSSAAGPGCTRTAQPLDDCVCCPGPRMCTTCRWRFRGVLGRQRRAHAAGPGATDPQPRVQSAARARGHHARLHQVLRGQRPRQVGGLAAATSPRSRVVPTVGFCGTAMLRLPLSPPRPAGAAPSTCSPRYGTPRRRCWRRCGGRRRAPRPPTPARAAAAAAAAGLGTAAGAPRSGCWWCRCTARARGQGAVQRHHQQPDRGAPAAVPSPAAAAADGGADTVGCADGAAVASWGGSQPVLQLELR
jgi:hypothetical protein